VIKPQWYVNCQTMGPAAMQVRSIRRRGRVAVVAVAAAVAVFVVALAPCCYRRRCCSLTFVLVTALGWPLVFAALCCDSGRRRCSCLFMLLLRFVGHLSLRPLLIVALHGSATWCSVLTCNGEGLAQAVRSGELELMPADPYEKIWAHWMETPQDWCISRQLWWGHRIPVYFVRVAGGKNDVRAALAGPGALTPPTRGC
jgi:valyl-tRNA synthetase